MESLTLRRFLKKGPLPALICGSLLFVLLYGRFLSGDAVYLYTDIGSDSVSSSFPLIVMLERMIRSSRFGGYEITVGLGTDTTATFMKYLNPVKTPLLFFNPATLPAGLLVSLFLEMLVLVLAGWLFFRRLLKNETAATAASLFWVFSGYVTLWSQNLSAGGCLAAFTVMMASLLALLMEPTFRRSLLFSASLALLLLTDYYYAWMSAWFVLVFMLFFAWSRKVPLRVFRRQLLMIVPAAVFACGLAAFSLVPALASFTGSVRTGAASGIFHGIEWNSPASVLTSIGRLYSVGFFGSGSSYHGTSNYFEQAVLSTTCLVVPALTDRLLNRKSRRVTAAALALSVFTLISKNAAALLQFNRMVQRFSYLITFASVIAIGLFLKDLLTEQKPKRIRASTLAGTILTLGLLAVLLKADSHFGIETDRKTVVATALFAVLWCIFILIFTRIRVSFDSESALSGTALSRCRIRRAFPVPLLHLLLFCLLSAELLVMNADTLYNRVYVTRSSYQTLLSSMATQKAVQKIQQKDRQLFRISATEDPTDANIGTLLEFPASSVYSNTNPSSLGSFRKEFGLGQISANHFVCDGSHFAAFPLLGGRELIQNRSSLLKDTLPSSLFEADGTAADDTLTISRVRNALPFGYLYTRTIDREGFERLSFPDRLLTLFYACHLTEGAKDSQSEMSTVASFGEEEADQIKASFQSTDLLSSGTDPNMLAITHSSDSVGPMTVFTPSGSDPYLFYDLKGTTKERSVRLLWIHVRGTHTMSSTHTMEVFFLRNGQKEPDPEDRVTFQIERGMPDLLLLLPDDVSRIRLDFPDDRGVVRLSTLSVLTLNDASSLTRPLTSTDVTGIRMEGGTYKASVRSDQAGIFCVPILFSRNWTASVNGEKVSVLNINGGLTGIPVRGGTSDIVLTWHTPAFQIAAYLSFVLLLLWLAAFLLLTHRRSTPIMGA